MRKILLLTLISLAGFLGSKSQNFTFNCTKDTIVACGPPCITVKAKIPDITSPAGNNYAINPLTGPGGCFRQYVDPGVPGTPTSLTQDDYYSTAVTPGFPFPFYGVTYNQLLVVANGYITFDISKAGQSGAPYGILNGGGFLSPSTGPPEDLPSTLYDKATIMGPYHDIDPEYTTESPTLLIKYDVVGAAPYRKWILSFYKVPLFKIGTPDNCDMRINNTHQIVLYESLGIIEVIINDMEQCPSWNEGRAMIGLQDFNRTNAIMAPGRKASDPAWGTIGMNESWRFVPIGGASLLKKVELYDITNTTLIATGTTTNIGNGVLEASFPNVCPPSNVTTKYLVRSTYSKFDDATVDIIGLDTLNVLRQNVLPASLTQTPTACGTSTGTITATANGGTGPYTFVLNPGNVTQTSATNSTTFTGLPIGPYTVDITDAAGCTTQVSITVTNALNLTSTYITTPTSCPGVNDGTIKVTLDIANAAGPYTFTLTGPGGPYTQTNVPSPATFAGLAAGTYSVTFNNAGGCNGSQANMVVAAGVAPLGTISHVNTTCPGVTDGTVTITATAGAAAGPYTFTLTGPGGPFTLTNVPSPGVFNGLATGTYTGSFTNAAGCIGSVGTTTIFNGSAPTGTITHVNTTCPGATDGTVTITATAGAASGPYTFTLTGPGGPYTLTNVPSPGVFTGLATGTYTGTFLNAAGCTGSPGTTTISNGAAPTGTFTAANTTCPGAIDGTVTITPAGGAAAGPYNITLNPGGLVQNGVATAATFSGLGPNTYTATFTTPLGCTGTVSAITVANGPGPTGTSTFVNSTCPGANNGSITITPAGGAAAGPYNITLNPGGFVQNGVATAATFNNLAPNNYTATFTTAAGCNGTVGPVAIVDGTAPTGTSTFVNSTCPGANDGSITITPAGGAAGGPYNITLNPGNIVHNGVATFTTFNGLAPNTYTATFTTPLGCTGTVGPVTIVDGAAPTGTATATNTTCPGADNGTVTITPAGGAAAGPYNITLNPGGFVQNGVTTATFTALPPNTYTATFTTPLGCTGTVAPVTVANGPVPTATITATNTNCPGVNDGTVTVTPDAGAANGPYNITLNPGAIVQNGVALSATFTGLAPNTYTATFTNAFTCVATTAPVIVLPGPAVTGTAVTTNTSCPTVNDGTITITPGGTGPYTYTLNPGAVVQVNNPVYTGLAPNTYTVTFVTGSGCNGTVTINPIIAAGPYLTSSFTQFDPPCANINDGTITITTTGVSPYTVVLTGPGGPYTQTNVPSPAVFTGLAPGTYNYSFTDSYGCTGTGGPITLTTHSPITTTVTLTEPLCHGNANGIITLNAAGGVPTYQYALSPFVTYQPTGVFNGLIAGTYTIRIKDNVGCTKDTTVTLNEPLLLTATATSTPATCSGLDGTITVTGHDGTPAYQYSVDNGVTYQVGQTFTVPPGPYNFINVRDANQCVATTTVVVGLIDNMFLDLGPDSTICAGRSVTFQPITNPETSVFLWSTVDAPISTIDTINIKNATAIPLDTSTYILHAVYGACSRTDSITLNVLHKPIANAGPDQAICNYTDSTLLTGLATDLSGPVKYLWTPSALVGNDSIPITFAYFDSTHASQLFLLTVTDNYGHGCDFVVKDSVMITVKDPVPAFAGNDTLAITGVPHQLFGSGGSQYLWTPSAPLSNPFSPTPTATLYQDTKFILMVTDDGGCIAYDTVFVKVYNGPAYYVPNAFSPNGDGINDIFRVVPVGIATTEWFRVFNRLGELVFETNQWLKGWDGTYKGKPQSNGAYVWAVRGYDKNGRLVEEKGTVLIVK